MRNSNKGNATMNATSNPMGLTIDTTPLPETTPADCGLVDWASRTMTVPENMAAGMVIASLEAMGIAPQNAGPVECQMVAIDLASGSLGSLLAPGHAITSRKVASLLAKVSLPARDLARDRVYLAALFADSFRVGPWHS